MKIQKQISQKAYIPGNGFISRYQRLIKDKVIPYQYSVLCDNAEGAEKSHVIANFINAGKALIGEDVGDGFYGMVFQDSDAAKWLEAVGFSLAIFPDPELEKTADELIDIIADAQDADGYLNTYFTIKDKDKRWQNLLEGHELYCSGHMMEAACAYYEATGKDKLLNVMLKNAEHIYDFFITKGNPGYPGHPEIELALMKMFRLTGNKLCLELCKHFIDCRGVDLDFYKQEANKRSWTVWGSNPEDLAYRQAQAPVREQTDATGHAVRAVYLYTGMADLASEIEDSSLFNACKALWDSITKKQMYVTGGIGSTVIGEAFSVDYDLPNDTAYAETCASIGLIFFASRMLENEVNSEYADVMERAFYNTVLAGMQLDGKRFFYVNPLECVPGISGVAPTHHHDLTVRPKWYACACCPPNVARLISSFGKYAYGENADTIYCHMYADGEISFENGIKLSCETEYPYGFEVKYKVLTGDGKLAVRIPAWSKNYGISINSNKADIKKTSYDSTNLTEQIIIENGYAYIQVKKGDEISLILDSSPYRVYASTKVPKLTGQTAICRGPLVYCFEGVDNNSDVLSLSLNSNGKLSVADYDASLLHGTCIITAESKRTVDSEDLYSTNTPERTSCQAVAVPYYTWGNRGENQMRVWMNEI